MSELKNLDLAAAKEIIQRRFDEGLVLWLSLTPAGEWSASFAEMWRYPEYAYQGPTPLQAIQEADADPYDWRGIYYPWREVTDGE